jgi:hypothetical protein
MQAGTVSTTPLFFIVSSYFIVSNPSPSSSISHLSSVIKEFGQKDELMSHYLEIAGIVLVLYLGSAAFKIWSLRSCFNKAAREHGCKPANHYPNLDPFFGLDLLRLLDRENERGKRIEVFVDLHRKYGETFKFKSFSTTRISTCSPKNIQAIATSNFDDWELNRCVETSEFHSWSKACLPMTENFGSTLVQ